MHIILINAEKSLNEVQWLFVIKIFSQTRRRLELLQYNNGHLQKRKEGRKKGRKKNPKQKNKDKLGLTPYLV